MSYMSDQPTTPKHPTMIRVPMRIAGKLVSFRIEEPSLEDIDRMARSQGMDRSRWIRHACHVQLVLDMIENGDGHELHDPLEVEDELGIGAATVEEGQAAMAAALSQSPRLLPGQAEFESRMVAAPEDFTAPTVAEELGVQGMSYEEPVIVDDLAPETIRPNRWS